MSENALMVDRIHRAALKELLQAMATGRITTGEFVGRIGPLERSADPGVVEIIESMADFDNDLAFNYRLRGRNRLSKAHRRMVARAILFLKSDRPYEWEREPATVVELLCGLSATVELCLSAYYFTMGFGWWLGMQGWNGYLSLGVLSAAAGILTIVWLVRRPRPTSHLRPPGDRDVWPYFRKTDCDEDCRLPKAA